MKIYIVVEEIGSYSNEDYQSINLGAFSSSNKAQEFIDFKIKKENLCKEVRKLAKEKYGEYENVEPFKKCNPYMIAKTMAEAEELWKIQDKYSEEYRKREKAFKDIKVQFCINWLKERNIELDESEKQTIIFDDDWYKPEYSIEEFEIDRQINVT